MMDIIPPPHPVASLILSPLNKMIEIAIDSKLVKIPRMRNAHKIVVFSGNIKTPHMLPHNIIMLDTKNILKRIFSTFGLGDQHKDIAKMIKLARKLANKRISDIILNTFLLIMLLLFLDF